jgi:GT2 family glycosyltransferase
MDSLISNFIKKLNNQNIKSMEKHSYKENTTQKIVRVSNEDKLDENNISIEHLLSIYNRRDDLQDKFPEVKQKNDFTGLRNWYNKYGINEIVRLKTDNANYTEYDKWKIATRNIWISGSRQKITNKHPEITVIVTVHNHANVVIPCIESVLKWTSMPYNLLIVNDASTEQELLLYLEKISKFAFVKVVHNEPNLGYLMSVNNAIRSTLSDVVLLNSDTIVTKNWLDKMYSCAYSNDKISTVSPLSNNATLCSVPEFMKPNEIPKGMTVDSFAEMVEKVSEYNYPIISTCVGFCMYIKRKVIDKIGLFDEVFSPGYEEENDFCMRAYKAGFVSVLDDSTFIFHIGRSSFQEQTSRLEEDHMKLILKKHPEYLAIVSGFSVENPLRRIQEKIKKSIIKADGNKFKNVLMVLHRPVYAQNPGGTEDFCRMLYEGIDGFSKYLLYAADNNVIVVEENAPSGRRILYRFKRGDVVPGHVTSNKSEEEFFSSILDELNIDLVHFHHLLYLPLNFFHIAKDKGLKTIISIHDFYYMCPRIYLFEKGEYDGFCNACVDLDRCDRCLKMVGYEKGFQNEWRKECQKMFERADLVITPTKSTLDLYKKVYHIYWTKAKIIEHGIKTAELFSDFSSPDPPSKTMKIGFIGAVKTDRKGKDIILDLLRLDKNNNVEWHFFGRDSDLTELIKSRNIKPVGKIVNHGGWDKSENLPDLLHKTGIHIVIIPSQECYSIVLSEVWAAHIPVIVPNLVALGDRVREDTPGWTYPFPSSAEEILALLNKIFMNPRIYAEKTAKFQTLQVRSSQDCIREYKGIYGNIFNILKHQNEPN